jgi:N6-adenosine-specific RNA methylase IME4
VTEQQSCAIKLPRVEGGFACIYADPPWRFQFRGRTDGNRRVIENTHYRTMTVADIKAMPVREVAGRDCWLFLWVTWPFLEEAFRVMRRWGFRYSSSGFVWPKLRETSSHALFLDASDFVAGTGYTTRKKTEVCLLGRRGSPRRLNADVGDLLIAPRRQHSRKPDSAYPAIERFCAGPYLELFARTERPGWTSWGDEVGKFAEVS